jgi:hypothetical protein
MGSWRRPHGAAAYDAGRGGIARGQGRRWHPVLRCSGHGPSIWGEEEARRALKNDIEEGPVGGFIHKKVGYHRIVDEGLGL